MKRATRRPASATADHRLVCACILSVDASKACSGSVLLVPRIRALGPATAFTAARSLYPYELSPDAFEVVGYNQEHYCEVRTQAQHEDCVMHLVAQARELRLCPVVAAETWTSGRWSHKAKLGMGEAWGWWTAELRRAQEHIPELGSIHVEKVDPNTWRDDLFGLDRPKEAPELKKLAVWYANAVAGKTMPVDVAEGFCVGAWAAQQKSVHEVVRKWRKRNK